MKLEQRGVSKRLRVTVGMAIIIPILVMCLGLFTIGRIQNSHLKEKYGIEMVDFKYVPDSIHIYDALTEPVFEEIKEIAKDDPDTLLDAIYLTGLNAQLKEAASYLIIKEEKSIKFIGNDQAYNMLDRRALEVRDGLNYSDEFSTYIGGESPVLVKCTQFYFEKGELGHAYIITDATQTIAEANFFIENGVLLIFLILTVVSIYIMFFLGVRYVRPIRKLEKSLVKIAQGNYDEPVAMAGTKEIQDMADTITAIQKSLQIQKENYLIQEDEVREVLSNISHDIKTPITSIRGYTEGLRDGIANTKEKEIQYLSIILQKTNDLDKLLNELSLYSKVQMKHLLYDYTRMNVKEYFDDCAEEFKIDLENQGFMMVYANYVGEEVAIRGDGAQLSRVMHNIVNNTMKYMDKDKGVVILSVTEEGENINIKIEDNGSGIRHDELCHIFDRFYRTDKSRNSDTGGSGIGLAIAKEIVQEHKGEIWATSKEGVGTIIHITIPKDKGE